MAPLRRFGVNAADGMEGGRDRREGWCFFVTSVADSRWTRSGWRASRAKEHVRHVQVKFKVPAHLELIKKVGGMGCVARQRTRCVCLLFTPAHSPFQRKIWQHMLRSSSNIYFMRQKAAAWYKSALAWDLWPEPLLDLCSH